MTEPERRLSRLLLSTGVLYGVICRDATFTDIELYAQAGYHLIWLDLEHGTHDLKDAMRLCRAILHLGMAPVARIPQVDKNIMTHLQDAGCELLVLPDVRTAAEAAEFARLAKFPPEGQRGVASTSAAAGFAMGPGIEVALARLNRATHLMVQIESDQGMAELYAILRLPAIDMVTVGPLDWSVGQGLLGAGDQPRVDERIDRVLAGAKNAGKIVAAAAGSPKQAERYLRLGARLLFTGIDIAMKRSAFAANLEGIQRAAAAQGETEH